MGQLFSKRIGLEEISSDDVVIVVIGPSGVGKSTFINTAAGKSLLGVGSASGLKRVKHVRCTIQIGSSLKQVVFVDTPAFPDPDTVTEMDVATKIQKWTRKTFGRNMEITGILYLHRIIDHRTRAPVPHYLMFKKLFGEDFHTRVLLVTTMWEELSNRDDGERRKRILRRHWRQKIKGSAVVCHNGEQQSAWEVVQALLELQTN